MLILKHLRFSLTSNARQVTKSVGGVAMADSVDVGCRIGDNYKRTSILRPDLPLCVPPSPSSAPCRD
mgnify:CR=1 FL=1